MILPKKCVARAPILYPRRGRPLIGGLALLMPDLHLRQVIHFPTLPPRSQAHIGFLKKEKIILIESPERIPDFPAHQKKGADDGLDLEWPIERLLLAGETFGEEPPQH